MWEERDCVYVHPYKFKNSIFRKYFLICIFLRNNNPQVIELINIISALSIIFSDI